MSTLVPANSQEPIRQLLDDSRRFLDDNKISIPFDIETIFTFVRRRIGTGNYPDDGLFSGGEKKAARGLYYLFDLAGNKSTLDNTDLSYYDLRPFPPEVIGQNAKTEADALHARWQALMNNLSIDYGLRVAECSHPDKEVFASLGSFVSERYKDIAALEGSLGMLYPSPATSLPEREKVQPLKELVQFLATLRETVPSQSRYYASVDDKERARIWQGQFQSYLPRGDETMDSFLRMIDQMKAANPSMPDSAEQTLNNIYATVSDLRDAYVATGITDAMLGTGHQQQRAAIDAPQSSSAGKQHGSPTGDASPISDTHAFMPSFPPLDEGDIASIDVGGSSWLDKTKRGSPGMNLRGKIIR